MFDVSFTELLVIGVVALVVIGPERLPKVARTMGHLIGRAQRYVNDVKNDIQREIELEELRKFKTDVEDAAHGVQASLRDTEVTLRTLATTQPHESATSAEPADAPAPPTHSKQQTGRPT